MTSDTLKRDIMRQLDRLPPEALREVLDFTVSLEQRHQQKKKRGFLLEAAGSLSGAPLSAEQIEKALYGNTETDV